MIFAVSSQSTRPSVQLKNVSLALPICLGRKWAQMQELSAPYLPLQHEAPPSLDSEGCNRILQSCSEQRKTAGYSHRHSLEVRASGMGASDEQGRNNTPGRFIFDVRGNDLGEVT
jgi:hypothetical protein